jgi:hypothetical protein
MPHPPRFLDDGKELIQPWKIDPPDNIENLAKEKKPKPTKDKIAGRLFHEAIRLTGGQDGPAIAG